MTIVRKEKQFAARCPDCGCEVDQGTFPVIDLRTFLRERSLFFFCPKCVAEWKPSEDELGSVKLCWKRY
jgi:hypothetical protein